MIGLVGSMVAAFRNVSWRGAIGLIAAYALVLQAFFAYGMATQASAHDSGELFVICLSQDSTTAADPAATPVPHCPACTIPGLTAATLPDPFSLPVWQPPVVGRTPFASAAALIFFHSARSGLSRGPPQNV
jgi:hypothetical protein